MSKDRRDKCKCGRYFYWDDYGRIVTCPHCGTEYDVDFDSTIVSWLVERVKSPVKYTTPAR